MKSGKRIGKNAQTLQEIRRKYDRYQWGKGELLGYFLFYIGLSIGLAWLFYRDIRGAVPIGGIVLPVGLKRKDRELLERQKQRLTAEFTDCIRLVAGGLAAGYSMENAWKNAEPDLEKLHGREAVMCEELRTLNYGVAVNEPIEKLLLDFADRSGLEDVFSFCQVFSFAKRSGGNLTKIIGNTVKQIGDKREVLQEIETVMSAKKLEQKIMNIIPLLLLAYVSVSSSDFISPLYQNLFGQIVMSICLAVYGLAFLLSEKIIRIGV